MRDIPGLAWIIGIFGAGAIALFFYTRLGPDMLPPAHSIWIDIEQVRTEIETRTLKIAERESSSRSVFPYTLQIDRLSNQRVKTGMAAKYLLHFTGPERVGSDTTWLSGGVDVGLVDFTPDGLVGTLRISALQRNATPKNP